MDKLGTEFIGTSVSSGTLRDDHLIDAFASFVRCNSPGTAENLDVYDLDLKRMLPDERGFILDDMFEVMNEIAPEGTIFSAHEGDGADFGFWTVVDEELFLGMRACKFTDDCDGLVDSDNFCILCKRSQS